METQCAGTPCHLLHGIHRIWHYVIRSHFGFNYLFFRFWLSNSICGSALASGRLCCVFPDCCHSQLAARHSQRRPRKLFSAELWAFLFEIKIFQTFAVILFESLWSRLDEDIFSFFSSTLEEKVKELITFSVRFIPLNKYLIFYDFSFIHFIFFRFSLPFDSAWWQTWS